VGVVLPRRSVHERVKGIAIDDEIALARDEEHLAASAREVAAGELIQPRRGCRRGRGRWGGGVRTGRFGGEAAGTDQRKDNEQQESSMIGHASV